MDKIICDVCGTSYPETASQCPICGYVRSSKAKSVSEEGKYTPPVRGGRFSSSEVKRRTSGDRGARKYTGKRSAAKGSNLVFGLVAIAFLAIAVFVIVLIVSNLFSATQNPTGSTEDTSEILQTESSDVLRNCLELHTKTPVIELAAEGAVTAIEANPVPSDTTDKITYVSMDPAIATVSADGKVTAVAYGETAVTVRCGNAVLVVTVKCTFAPEVPEGSSWSMNRKDITFSKKGETWDLYGKNSTIPKNLITWTSDDESVAKIESGIVEAVGKGKTKVHGEYNGVKYSCTIRCNLPKEEDTQNETKPDETKQDETKPEETEPGKTVKISHEDVTLRPDGEAVDKSFNLYLRDANGNKLDVTWKASEEGYVTIEGNLITAVKAGKTITVSTTYEDVTYKCIIRLK